MTTYYQAIIDRGGGIITCGNHLAVFVGPVSSLLLCQRSRWTFVDIETATVEIIAEAVEQANRNRWPIKEDGSKAQSKVAVRRVG